MGYMRRRAIAAQPHPAAASGEMMWVNIGEPKVKRLAVTFSPVQEGVGTPSPDNVRPIRGFSSITARIGGKNLLRFSPETWMYQSFSDGISYDYADGGVTITISREYAYVLYKICYITPDLVGVTFIRNLSYNGSSDALISCDLDGSNRTEIPADTNRGSTIRESDVGKYLALRIYIVGGPLTRTYTSLSQVEIGSVQTEREPYRAVTPSAYLGDTYYGGTVDLVSGTMTVTHGIVDLGSLAWDLRNDNSTRQAWRVPDRIPIKTEAGGNYKLHGISTQFASVALNDSWVPYIISYNDVASQQIVVTFPPSAYSTEDQVKAVLSGIPLVYELATPQTVTLTPQTIAALRGQQLVMNDSSPNLWTYEDPYEINPTNGPYGYRKVIFSPPLPPGTYRFSAAITSTDTDATTSCVRFMTESDADSSNRSELQSRIERSASGETHSLDYVTTAATHHLYLYCSTNSPRSIGDTATFRKISIERIW